MSLMNSYYLWRLRSMHEGQTSAQEGAGKCVRSETCAANGRTSRLHVVLGVRATASQEKRAKSTRAFPKKLCPLVFIYRSPTVKPDFYLHAMLFHTQVRALKCNDAMVAIAVNTLDHRKEIPWM
jgi:hypothetical protein